jgi:hypothetical protein
MRRFKTLVTAVVAVAMLAFAGTASAKSGHHDRDHDKMPDRWEQHHGLSATKGNARGDRDRDGLSNLGEFRLKLDPRDADTDDDGVNDGAEDADDDGLTNAQEERHGTKLRDADSDDDGIEDGADDDNDVEDDAGEVGHHGEHADENENESGDDAGETAETEQTSGSVPTPDAERSGREGRR